MILRPYQEVGRDWLASRRFALLADEMRVGKTPQAILAAAQIGAQAVLVVCPAIAVPHWKSEFDKWWHDRPQNPLICSFTKACGLESNYLLGKKWDVVIIDECHFAKNPEAQRTKFIYGKGGIGYRAERMWVLSGTPAPKHAGELWPMLRAFGVTGMTYRDFLWRYCYMVPGTDRPRGTRPSMIPELRVLLSRIMLRRKRIDVAPEMPGIDYQFLEVDPISRADMCIPTGLSDAALLTWLETHPAVDSADRIEVAKAKALPLVDEINFAVENGLLGQTVVFGWHVEPLHAVANGLKSRGISAEVMNGATSTAQRVRIQDDFLHGRLRVVVANILAAGTAIDLSAASHGYFLEMAWVPGNNVQAANRLISMDKREPVTVDVVTWPGSADDRVQKVLLRRAQELSKLY